MSRLLFLLLFILPCQLIAQPFTAKEVKAWKSQAKQVDIIRDNWGIPHIYGQTDADAVFGLMYAQCEDDFKRVEMNYIEKLGRLSEINGNKDLFNDLLIRMLIDSASAKADFATAPYWLQQLLVAFADGINYYLYTHPEVKPALLQRFEPWFPLLWTDGSIGAINTSGITAKELEHFYAGNDLGYLPDIPTQPLQATGSNGFAIAAFKSETGNAMLYINPHVSFYFRPEVHMVSEEGLNAYGAVTWGQFFIYQGFNEFCGWMHTSGDSDVADLYEEKMKKKGTGYIYKYDQEEREVKERSVQVYFKAGSVMESRRFTVYETHHGPVMAKRKDKWISLASVNRNMNGLIQSWQRTKATGFDAYKKVMSLVANASNNTVYADAAGNIAYWHGNFIPKRNPGFNWQKPVDGTVTATDWMGLHSVDESIHLYNPSNGWLQNCNSTPFTSAGTNSPDKTKYPAYMSPGLENFRGINAVRVLQKKQAFNIDKLIAAGYDTYLAGFEQLQQALVEAYKKDSGRLHASLAGPIAVMENWDLYANEQSVATTLAIEWGDLLKPLLNAVNKEPWKGYIGTVNTFAATASQKQLLETFEAAINKLIKNHGTWQVPWGEINRYQRLSGQVTQQFDDTQPSLPVGFAGAEWGMLPSFTSNYFPGTVKRYGVYGNSFVCAVEFGKKIKAKSLLAGGESSNPASPHFNDQALMYSKGKFKDVLFYKQDVLKHAVRKYHPGE